MAEPAADPTIQIAQLSAENEALKKRLEVSKLKDEDIKDLEELVAELERETARETKRANIATSSLNSKTREFKVVEDELRGEIDRLEGELADARAELEVPRPGPEHLATIDELKGQVLQLEKQVSEHKSRADSLEQKLSAAVSQAAEEKRRLEERLSEEQRKVVQLEDEKRRAVEEGQMQVKAVKAVATKTEIKKNELQAEVNNLTTQVKVLTEEKARYIEKESNWNRARSELEELVTNLSQASKNLDIVSAERTATMSRKQELEANLKMAEQREQEWIRQRAEMEINIKAQTAKEQSWIMQRSELEANIRVFQEKEKMWQQQKEQLDAQIRDLHSREQAWMDKRIELESGVKALSVTTQGYDQTRSELERVTRSFTMNEAQWNQQRQEYESNLRRVNDERSQLQDNLTRLTQEREDLKQTNQSIQRDLEEMKSAYAKLYDASTQLTQQLAAYQEKEMAWVKEKALLQATADESKLGPMMKEKEVEWQQAVQSLQDELVRARLTETQSQALIAEEVKKQGALQKQLGEESKRTEAAQAQVRTMQSQVKQLQQEIDKAQEQLRSVTAEKEKLDAALTAKSDEFNRLAPQQQADTQLLRMAVEEEKKAGALRVQALDAKLQAAQKEVERLTSAASESQLKINQQKVDLDRLNAEFDRLTKSLNTERDDRIRKETELSSLKSAIAAGAAGSGGSLGQWQAERAKLEAEMVLVKQAGARTAAQMVAEERKQTAQKEQGWLKERAELEKGLTALTQQVSDLQQQLGNATEELRMVQDTLDAERKAAVEHAELWQDEKKQLEEGMVTLHSSVQEWEKAFNEAITAATSNQEQYANQIRTISDDRKRIQQRLDQMQKDREEIDKKLLNSNAERAKFEAQTLRLMAELEDLKSRPSARDRSPTPSSPVSPSMQAKLETLVQEKNQLTTVVADLTRTLNEKERLLSESSQRIESLQQSLRDTSAVPSDAPSGAEASQLKLRVIELQDELNRVNSTFSAAMADKDTWDTQRKAYENNITSLQQHITQLTTTAKQLQGNQVQLQAFVSTLQKQITDGQKEREALSQKMLEQEMESKRAVAALKRDLYSQLQDASNRSLELANALAEERKAHQSQLKGGAVSQIVDAERQSFQVASNNWQKERDAFQQTIAQQQARLTTLEASEGIWRQEQLRLEDKISRLTGEITLQKQDIKGLERDLKHTMMQSQASLDMRADSEAKWEAEREQMRKYVIGLKIGWVFKDKLRAKVKATLLAQMQQLAERCSLISSTLAQERKETAEVLSQWRERELEWLSQREQLISVINMAKTSHGQAGQFIEKAQSEWMDEKAALENQVAQFQDVLTQYQEQVTAHQASVQNIVNDLVADLDRQKQACEELQAQLNASEEERMRVKNEYDRLRLGYQKDMAAAKMDLYVKLQAVATKSASLSQALADERKQSAEVVKGWLAKEQDWIKQRAEAEAAMGEKKATIHALEQKVGEVLSENMVYHERLAQMEQIVRMESAKGGDLSSKLNAQFSEFREKQQGFAQLRTDLEERLFDTREELTKLTEQHQELKALHARNTTALAETNAKLTTVSEQLQIERARNKSNEDTFREQLRSHEANVFGLEQAVRRLGAELNVPKLVTEHTELTILVKQLTEEREETIARQFAENLMMAAERSDRQNTQEMLESRLHGVLAESAAKDKEIARLRVLATDSLNELTEESGRATVSRIRLFEEKARIDLVEEEFEDTVNHLVSTYEDRIQEMELRNEEDRRFKAAQLQELVDEFNTREDQLLNEIDQLENDLEEAHALIGGGAAESKTSTETDNDELRAQIATLSEQLQLANQEIAELMDNLDEAERDLQEEIGRNSAMRFEVAAANRARRDAQEELADTALTMEKYYRDVTESLVTKLQTQRADAEAKYAEKSQQAADEVALLTETVESLESQLDTAQVELDHLWQEKREADARVESLEDVVADLHDEKHTQAELTHLMQEQQSLFSIVGGPGVSSVKVVELVTQLDVMRGENKQLKLAINEMHKEFQEAMAKSLSDVEIVGMALAESLLSKQQERYNRLLEQQQEMYETNEKKIGSEADRAQAAADSQIATLRSAIEEQVIVITELRNKIDSLKDNVTAREKETLEHEEELLRMEDQIAELAFLADNARAEDLTTHAELEEERRRSEMLNEEILRLQETESQLREQVTRQAAELNKLQFVNRVLQEQNASFSTSIQKQISMTESTKSELRNIKHTAREAVMQVEELTAKLQVLHKQNSELSSRIDGTHREVDAIRDTIARLTATGENTEGGEEKAAKSFFTFRSPSKKNLSKDEVRDGKVKIPKDPKAMQELLQGVLDLLRTQQQDLDIWEKKYPDMESEVTEARYQIKRTVQEQNALRDLLTDTENRLHELQDTYTKDKASELEALTLFQDHQAQIQPVAVGKSRRK